MLDLRFANLGRHTTAHVVEEAMNVIRTSVALDSLYTVIGLNEIDEADTGYSDHDLLRQVFRRHDDWRLHHMDYHEPILTHGVHVIKDGTESYPACSGLAHQTPPRRIQQIMVPTKGEPDAAVLVGHPPAGAKNGERPPATKKALLARYAAYENKEDEVTDRLLSNGRHVIKMMDRNWTHYKPRPREVVVESHGPDWITVIPAPGYEVEVMSHFWHPLPIEHLHGLLTGRIQFHKAA